MQTISTLGTNGGRNYPLWIPYVIWQISDQTQPPVDALNAISPAADEHRRRDGLRRRVRPLVLALCLRHDARAQHLHLGRGAANSGRELLRADGLVESHDGKLVGVASTRSPDGCVSPCLSSRPRSTPRFLVRRKRTKRALRARRCATQRVEPDEEAIRARLARSVAPVAFDAVELDVLAGRSIEEAEGGWPLRWDRRVLASEPVDPFAFLPQVRCPVHVMAGSLSDVMPPDQARRFAAAVSGATLEGVADVGNHVELEAPGLAASRIRELVTAG